MRYRNHRPTVTEQLLATVTLFERCSDKELSTIATWATDLTIQQGRSVCHENVTRPQFVIVLDGCLELSRAGSPVATVNAGEWFGHDALLDHRVVEGVNAIACKPTRLIVFSARDFVSLLNLAPSIRVTLAAPTRSLTPITTRTPTAQRTTPLPARPAPVSRTRTRPRARA
jgi:CRP-like cAMP-binding protein